MPRSLYTSILPKSSDSHISHAIAHSRAPRGYIANLRTQPGETKPELFRRTTLRAIPSTHAAHRGLGGRHIGKNFTSGCAPLMQARVASINRRHWTAQIRCAVCSVKFARRTEKRRHDSGASPRPASGRISLAYARPRAWVRNECLPLLCIDTICLVTYAERLSSSVFLYSEGKLNGGTFGFDRIPRLKSGSPRVYDDSKKLSGCGATRKTDLINISGTYAHDPALLRRSARHQRSLAPGRSTRCQGVDLRRP